MDVTFNTVVLAILHQQRELNEYMRMLYQVLAALDIILGIVWCSWSVIWYCFKSPDNCITTSKVLAFLHRTLVLSVVFCLCGITFNLYLLITRPLRYYNIVTRARFFSILSSTLIVIVLVCGIYLPIPLSPFSLMTGVLIEICLNDDLSIHTSQASSVDGLIVIIPICLVLSFTLVIYIKLLAIAYKKNVIRFVKRPKTVAVGPRENLQDHSNQPPTRPPNLNDPRREMVRQNNAGFYTRFKGIITVLLLWGSFCVVWIVYILEFSLDKPSSSVKMFLDVVAVSNTWIQPMLYLLTNEEARTLSWKLLQRLMKRRS